MGFFDLFKTTRLEPTEVRGVEALIPNRSITTVTINEALTIGAVYRCVNIIATSISQCPINVLRNDVEPISVPSFIANPTLGATQRQFLYQTATSLALDGNAYWLITRKGSEVVNIQVLGLGQVQVEQLHDKTVRYLYEGTVLDPANLKHLKLCDIAGRATGLGAIQAAKKDFQNALDNREYAIQFFSDGAVPSGILSTDQHLNSDQAEDLRSRFIATQQKNTPAVLSNGLEYQALKLSPKEIQMLETRNFSVQEVARIFGIPATFLLAQSGDSQTYANLETVNRAFVNFTLMNYFGVIEDAFSSLLPIGVNARFDLDNFLRGDTASRYTAYESGIRSGWLTRNEVRQYEGLIPLPNLENTNNGTTT